MRGSGRLLNVVLVCLIAGFGCGGSSSGGHDAGAGGKGGKGGATGSGGAAAGTGGSTAGSGGGTAGSGGSTAGSSGGATAGTGGGTGGGGSTGNDAGAGNDGAAGDAATDGSPGDGAGNDATGDGQGEGGSGAIEICVLNDAGPTGACADPTVLAFGTQAAGTRQMRLFRLDNKTGGAIVVQSVTIASAAFSVATVRYEVDPGDPNNLLRVAQTLPATRASGTSLYFEVSFTSGSTAGPLPANEVHVAAGPSGAPADVVVPMTGSTAACPAGKAACDSDPTNGCETDTATDASHCGSCTNACALANADASCSSGQCAIKTCHVNFDDCNGMAADGCETNLATDVTHCGSCATACAFANAGASCQNKTCVIGTCTPGFDDCNTSATDGCETNLATDVTHCGTCATACAFANAGASCQNKTCVLGTCTPGFDDCNTSAIDGCETNLATDVTHCGTCATACAFANAGASCQNKTCVIGTCTPGFDNCNGMAADGCESNLMNDPAHCGACGNNCANVYPHAQAACAGGGTCQFLGCQPNFWDLDGNPSNGCEYACTQQGTTDTPDDTFTDQNCDGVDGDVSQAIFVATSGNDANPGTMQAPMRTINAALAKAAVTAKPAVYVSEGIYVERVMLMNGVSIYGGYSAVNNWARSAAYVTSIQQTVVSSGRLSAVEGQAITLSTTLDRLTIATGSTSQAGVSNYAMYCSNCGGVTLKNSVLMAGSAGPGTIGSNGAVGANGVNGQGGFPGSCDNANGGGGPGGVLSCGGTNVSGGNGGAGGPEGSNNGQAGTPGANGGGIQGAGGAGCTAPFLGSCTGSPGGPGQSGGASAAAGNAPGGGGFMIVTGFWFGNPGGNGATGPHGRGGGGGGGGGGQGGGSVNDGGGNGGGGGGSGSCGGTGATGGTAGGGSFGLFLVNSTGFVMTANTISSGNGGGGGAGGTGGAAGIPGSGTPGATACTGEVGAGGNGGNGGAGGRGGHGGGGAGGASYAVFRSGTTVATIGNNLSFGAGGPGGASPGNPGVSGASGQVF